MKVYHYDPVTMIFCGESEADESPLEPGVFLIPAHATDQAPPSPSENEVVVWGASGWELVTVQENTEPQAPLVPGEITAWQGLTILNRSGLYASVKAYVDALPDDEEGTQAKIDFYRASVWKRSWAWLNSVATSQFSMTDKQIDEMFIAASVL